MDAFREKLRAKGFTRPRDGRLIGGVCAGLGAKLGIAPWPSRLLFVLVLMLLPGSQFLVYPILWILMPTDDVPVPTGHQTYGSPQPPLS